MISKQFQRFLINVSKNIRIKGQAGILVVTENNWLRLPLEDAIVDNIYILQIPQV